MLRIMIFILGILACSIGLSFTILYLNLLTMGYSFFQYVHFIISTVECNCLLLGILLIYLSFKRWEINELLLRCFNKFKR